MLEKKENNKWIRQSYIDKISYAIALILLKYIIINKNKNDVYNQLYVKIMLNWKLIVIIIK